MIQLISCLFFLSIAFSSYQTAKRSGQWSWKLFLIVIAVLVAVPILIILPLISVPWLQGRPELATLIIISLIIVTLGVLAFLMRRYISKPKQGPQ